MLVKTVGAADAGILWRGARIAYKLDPMQREIYEMYRVWEAKGLDERRRGIKQEGLYPRMFCLDMSRRTGKDMLSLLIRIEDAIRRPGSILSYGTELIKDVGDIIVPLANMILSDCPQHLRPVHRDSYRGQAQGLYFPNDSVIKLVGCERTLDGLRGRGSDGCSLSESAYIGKLEEAIGSVLMPQLLGRQHATLLLNSTPNIAPGHIWDVFCVDAQNRGAYAKRTLMDSPRYSDAEKLEFINAAGGLESDRCKVEYFVQRIRSEIRTIIPEFDAKKHVKASPIPKYCRAMTLIDPGVRDLCGITFCYHDFERDKFVVRRDWAKRGANTNEVVAALRQIEGELWHGENPIVYWDKDRFKPNPCMRISDVDLLMITDLNSIHKILVSPADKVDADAALHALRNAVQAGKVEFHPEAEQTIAHFQNGTWNDQRTSFSRHPIFGHWDLIETVKYGIRHWQKHISPEPPNGIVLNQTVGLHNMHYFPQDMVTKRKAVDVVKGLFKRTRVGRRR